MDSGRQVEQEVLMGDRDAYSARRGKRQYAFKPATVATSRRVDEHTLQVHCNGCQHRVIESLDGMPGGLVVVDIPATYRLVGWLCGPRNIGIMKDVAAHYDR